MSNVKPGFFIIGAPKCGTTALSEYLSTHPNVFFCPIKEPLYFASDFKKRIVSTEKVYMRQFQNADSDLHKAIGEGSSIYMFSKVAVSNILKFQPEAKFIVMVRNPVDLVVSFHSQLLRTGNEKIASFLDAWDAEDKRKAGKNIPFSCMNSQYLHYSEWGKIGTQLKRVIEDVPQEQIKVIIFDDFIQNTRDVYLDVLEFLSIADDGRTTFPKINERRSPKNQTIQNILGLTVRYWLPLRSRIMHNKSLGLWNFVNKRSTFVDYSKIDPDLEIRLINFYVEEILLLQDLLQRDLSPWLVGEYCS